DYEDDGDVFCITNTGPNVCGYFGINNVGSTAGAVYGSHNGAGSAVFGWHMGTGSAIKGVANGPGYAGEFDGSVTVTEDLTVDHSAAVGGTLAVHGFSMSPGAQEGYVLRCADMWGNAEWGPPNVIDSNKGTSEASLAGGDVVNQSGAEVTLTVPGPGYIVVESRVWFKFDHTGGTADKLYLGISTSPGALPTQPYDRVFWEDPASLGDASDLDRTVHVSRTFEITSGGTYTYYLVGQMPAGANIGDKLFYSQTTGVYYPYPVVTRAASDEQIAFPTTGDGAPR
ncbi:hypothetical protein KAW64_10740, partial [bacterium]|nr:hypothetical protein [bacterium]